MNAYVSKIKTSLASLWQRVRAILAKSAKSVRGKTALVAAKFPRTSSYVITGWAFVSSWVQVSVSDIKLGAIAVVAWSTLVALVEFIAAMFLGWGFTAAVYSGIHLAAVVAAISAVFYIPFAMIIHLYSNMDAIVEMVEQRVARIKDRLVAAYQDQLVEEVSDDEAAKYKTAAEVLLRQAEDLLGSVA